MLYEVITMSLAEFVGSEMTIETNNHMTRILGHYPETTMLAAAATPFKPDDLTKLSDIVITSYSIHYTKLYEWASALCAARCPGFSWWAASKASISGRERNVKYLR